MPERPYCGLDGGEIVDQVAAKLIADPQLRQRWTEFDHRFLGQCVRKGELGIVFHPDGFAALIDVDEQLLLLGVKVYNAANREAVRLGSRRYQILNILAMIYHSACRACK